MKNGAELSPCGTYRYTLTRQFRPNAPAPMVFVMLNPSTADASQDDPTIRRCLGFADREGYGAILVVNLYALRAWGAGAREDRVARFMAVACRCLGKTKTGAPRHPLYLPSDAPLEAWP